MKPYAILRLTEDEFQVVRGALVAQRDLVFSRVVHATGDELRFYQGRFDRYDMLLSRCDDILVADTSQDAEEEGGAE